MKVGKVWAATVMRSSPEKTVIDAV